MPMATSPGGGGFIAGSTASLVAALYRKAEDEAGAVVLCYSSLSWLVYHNGVVRHMYILSCLIGMWEVKQPGKQKDEI